MLRFLGVAFVVVAIGSCSRSEPPTNIVLVSIDTLRRDALGCYGGRADVSPHLDAFAKRSIVFDQAISQAPWTLPSHAALLTSLYPSQLDLGTFGAPTPIAPAARRISEVLRDGGFQTFAITAGAFLVADLGFDRGFDTFDSRGVHMRVTVDEFEKKIDARDPSRPFFAFLHTYDVHKYNPSDEDRGRFVTVKRSKLSALPPQKIAETLQSNAKLEEVKAYGELERRHAREIYDAAVYAVDREIGRLLEGLRVRGLDKNTIVVITSDHGEEFWEHGRTGHGYNLHDENLRVPLLWFDPLHASARVDRQVRLIDVAPTLAKRVNLAAPADWEGVDLAPLVAGADLQLHAYSEAAHLPYKSIRSPSQKLIVSLRRPFRTRFDLVKDPQEQQDVFVPGGAIDRPMSDALRRFVLETSASGRYRGAQAITLDAEATKQLQELGYTAPGESVPSDAAPWLRALAGEIPNPAK